MVETPLTIGNRLMELALSPSVGGAIASFDFVADGKRVPILRQAQGPLDDVLESASFPLVPFSNRIRGGSFAFRGHDVRLQPNLDGDPSPLHGQGWKLPWSVERKSADEALLRFDHEPGEWPWAYRAEQHFRLESNSLYLRLTCLNLSDGPMPCGLGFHPYFPCGPDTRIHTGVDEVWTVDEHVLPVDRVAPDGRYSIADDPVCGRDLDNGYGGWSGRALFTDPGWPFEIELSSRSARFFQLFSPQGGGFFVAEPVSHANAALNEPQEHWPSLGIRILQSGEEMSLDCRISIQLDQPTG